MTFSPNKKRGGPMVFQGANTAPDGYQEVSMPAIGKATWFEDLERIIRNLYACDTLYHHIHACRVNGLQFSIDDDGAIVATEKDGTTYTLTPLDATLVALAATAWAANAIPIGTGTDTLSQVTFAANKFPARASTGDLEAKTITDFALTILDDTDAATVRTTIGAGTGSGDVTAAANITAGAVVVGDDGAKGVEGSVASISTSGGLTTINVSDSSGLIILGPSGGVALDTGAPTITVADGMILIGPEDADSVTIGRSGIITKANGTFETAGNIEVGHATDTTLSRSAAGVLAVEGVRLLRTVDVVTAIVDGNDTNSGSSTLAATDHMTLTVEAGTRYQFEAWLDVDYDDGFVFDFNGGTATMTSIRYDAHYYSSSDGTPALVVEQTVSALATDVTLAGAEETGAGQVHIMGHLNVNAAGTVVMRHAPASGAGGATVVDGSWMRLTKVTPA